MEKRLLDVLENKSGNHIMPFLWMHGEPEEKLREYMEKIHQCGIGAVCLESRPHPDFCGPGWWHDVDIIIDEAEKRGMKVWVFDDAHFPTGSANGTVKTAPDELCKQYLFFHTADVCGPMPAAELNVAAMAKTIPAPRKTSTYSPSNDSLRCFSDDKLCSVTAFRLSGKALIRESAIDLSSQVIDGFLKWDVPDGTWRIFVTYFTRNGGGRQHFINMASKASCQLQIKAVYEPHWEHYGKYFGSTFGGFFSDEQEFGNGTYSSFDNRIGKWMHLPWSEEMPEKMKARLGPDWKNMLAALWYPTGDDRFTATVRYAYMDVITRLAADNFSGQIAAWCRAHGVRHIGHTIEDNNQHARLDQSLGHYFRGLRDEDMAGIDDIGGQVLLGGEDHYRVHEFGSDEPVGDGEFYHFVLGKLGASHGHIDPRKQGQVMCEIFGVYGWIGIQQMKYLADHFLVRGVNHFVPHAFSPVTYPDPDMPPHFYANGHNPLFRHFGNLTRYMSRISHLFSAGTHIAPVALLYHGEAEWCGDYMLCQKPARLLAEHQIDYDIIPIDVFEDRLRYHTELGTEIKINREKYKLLIIPYARFIPAVLANAATEILCHGGRVIFLEQLPEGLCDSNDSLPTKLLAAEVVSLESLVNVLVQENIPEINVKPAFRRLRYFHYLSEQGTDMYLFTNEETEISFEGEILIPGKGSVCGYDAWDNVLRPLVHEQTKNGILIKLSLAPCQSIAVICDCCEGAVLKSPPLPVGDQMLLDRGWTLSLARSAEYPHFHDVHQIDSLDSVALQYPHFSGFMRYETSFILPKVKCAVLEIPLAYDGVEVWVNGHYAGMTIVSPHRYDLTPFVQPGENRLKIEVANSLSREAAAMEAEGLTTDSPRRVEVLPPAGIIGSVRVFSVL